MADKPAGATGGLWHILGARQLACLVHLARKLQPTSGGPGWGLGKLRPRSASWVSRATRSKGHPKRTPGAVKRPARDLGMPSHAILLPCWSTPAAPPPADPCTPSAQAPHSRVPPEQHVPGEGCRDVSPAPAGALSLPGGAAGRTSRWGSPGARRGNPSRPGSAGWGRRGPEALWVGHRPDGPAGPAAEDGDVSAEPGSGQPFPAVMQDTAVILWGSQGTASTSSHWSPSDRN